MAMVKGLLVLFGIFPFLDAADFRSDYQFNEEAEGWLKFHVIPATWQDARLRCHLEGAVLASPTNGQLMRAMGALINASSLNPPRAVFTGISAEYSKGDFFSIEGVPLSELDVTWARYEPNNAENSEDCLIMQPDGSMADVNCQYIYSYICYSKKTKDMPPMTECGTIDEGYKLVTELGRCYKFHNEARTWSEGFKTCVAEGGHLAIVNYFYEMEKMQELILKSYGPNGITALERLSVNLGFRYSTLQKTFLSIDGQPLTEGPGCAKWAYNEPSNAKTAENKFEGEYCGSMILRVSPRNEKKVGLNDVWCEHNYTFICEKDPKSLVKLPSEILDSYKNFLREYFTEEMINNLDQYGIDLRDDKSLETGDEQTEITENTYANDKIIDELIRSRLWGDVENNPDNIFINSGSDSTQETVETQTNKSEDTYAKDKIEDDFLRKRLWGDMKNNPDNMFIDLGSDRTQKTVEAQTHKIEDTYAKDKIEDDFLRRLGIGMENNTDNTFINLGSDSTQETVETQTNKTEDTYAKDKIEDDFLRKKLWGNMKNNPDNMFIDLDSDRTQETVEAQTHKTEDTYAKYKIEDDFLRRRLGIGMENNTDNIVIDLGSDTSQETVEEQKETEDTYAKDIDDFLRRRLWGDMENNPNNMFLYVGSDSNQDTMEEQTQKTEDTNAKDKILKELIRRKPKGIETYPYKVAIEN